MRPLVITGPTAAGKSAEAIRIAERFNATIVSMDAMQVYRRMDIGTAKIDLATRTRIAHQCIDIRNPDEPFSAADFVAEANAAIAEGGPVILCGGTPFYLRAFLFGLVQAPATDATLRERFEALESPHSALHAVDPMLAARLHPNDRVRLIRGLEYHAISGKRLSEMHDADPHIRRDCEVVWLDADDLYARIDARVVQMMSAGYLDEVRGLLASGIGRFAKPMQSLGYKHLACHVLDNLSLPEAVRLTQRDTRHFSRKQRTFLRGLGFAPGGDLASAADRAFLARKG